MEPLVVPQSTISGFILLIRYALDGAFSGASSGALSDACTGACTGAGSGTGSETHSGTILNENPRSRSPGDTLINE